MKLRCCGVINTFSEMALFPQNTDIVNCVFEGNCQVKGPGNGRGDLFNILINVFILRKYAESVVM